MRHPPRVLFALLFVVAVGVPAAPSVALAAPGNDNQASATVIAGFPFGDTADVSQATTEPGEIVNCNVAQTVWYTFTPNTNGLVKVDTSGSSFSWTVVNAYRQDAPGLGGLAFLNCATFGGQLTFDVQAGKTYVIQAGPSSFFGS